MTTPAAYANPYFAGVALGLVLTAAFAATGGGLGASGAFASAATSVAANVAPAEAARNPYFQSYLAEGAPWTVWMVVEVFGVIIGAALSAWAARRLSVRIDRGPSVSRRGRLAAAVGGGALMGAGALLARGCTSGLALSGGAMLSVGSWAFMLALFATGYAVAPAMRRLWQ